MSLHRIIFLKIFETFLCEYVFIPIVVRKCFASGQGGGYFECRVNFRQNKDSESLSHMINRALPRPHEPSPNRANPAYPVKDNVLQFSTRAGNALQEVLGLDGHAHNSEEEYWAAFRSWDLNCLVFDLDTLQIICATDKVSEVFGYSHREMEKYDLSILWPVSEFPLRFEFVKRTRELVSGDSGKAVPLRTADGGELLSRFTWRNVEYKSMKLRVVFFPELQATPRKP